MKLTKEEVIRLGWYLLECKFVYYHQPKGIKGPSDQEYDELEQLYKDNGGKELAVGFNINSPSGRLIVDRITRDKTLTVWRK